MNGSNGIVPTVDLATNNTYPYMGGGFGNGFFGGDGIWALVLLALLFGGNNGWGGFGNGGFNNIATTDYISSEFTQRDVNNGFQNTNNLISSGFADAATNTCNLRSDVLTGNMGIINAIQDAKFASAIGDNNTQRDVLMQTTQLENQLSQVALSNQAHIDNCCCELKALNLESSQRVIDTVRNEANDIKSLITSNTIQDLRDKLSNAETVISNNAVINTLAPRSIPAYLTSSPYQSIYSPYYGGFYGNGFYGNTII